MQRKISWNNPIDREKLLNDLVFCIPMKNTHRNLDMQISVSRILL